MPKDKSKKIIWKQAFYTIIVEPAIASITGFGIFW